MSIYAGFLLVAALILIGIVLISSVLVEARQRMVLREWLEMNQQLEQRASIRWRVEKYCAGLQGQPTE